MKRIKKFFTKKNIMITSLCLVVFVMSLGYAALSQYIELDGIASIDRSWIIKVTNVTNTASNGATNVSSNYVSNTVTLNSNLPTSNSTVTYTITLSNQGNIPAKLNNIDIIEDDNTNITYEITGLEEGQTTLNPGETNTARVVIKYKEGVTNISDTEKDIMLTFIYIDNSPTSTPGGSSEVLEEEYEEFKVGERVELVDGTIWYVTKESGSSEDKVTLVSENTASSNGSVATNGTYTMAFDTVGGSYDQYNSNNIGYFVKNTVETYIRNSINNNGGDGTGTTARLLTLEEYNRLTNDGVPSWMVGSYWWIMDTYNYIGDIFAYLFAEGALASVPTDETWLVRPVIITLKGNVSKTSLVANILQDNTPQSDVNIDFSKTSQQDGTKGLYYTSENTEDDKTVYYYRGAVENNYVSFAGYYWRIIRINEDESIRLILQGDTIDSNGAVYTYPFYNFMPSQSYSGDNADIGFMYGTRGSTTYSATHANTNSSFIQARMTDWYRMDGIESYEEYLADAGFCGDRSMASEAGLWGTNDTALGYGTNRTFYGTWNRLYSTYQPQFACPQENDLYTTDSSDKGNKALDYPIGLISADEVAYAGGVGGVANTSYYLYTGSAYWTISPHAFGGSNGYVRIIDTDGGLATGAVVGESYGIRPVINLKSDINITSGNGTSSDPYVILTE